MEADGLFIHSFIHSFTYGSGNMYNWASSRKASGNMYMGKLKESKREGFGVYNFKV
jgi:hypothetical protein